MQRIQGIVHWFFLSPWHFSIYLMALLVPDYLLVLTGIIKKNSYFQYKYYTYFVCLQVHIYCITKYVLILIILWVLRNTAGYNWGNIFDPSTKVCIGFHQTVSHTSQKGKSPKRHVWVWHNSFTFWYWNIQIKA